MKVLNIVETAFRATLEEQDDPVVWCLHALKGAGANLTVLLRGNAVNYAVEGQNVEPLKFGSWEQKHPPRIDRDIRTLIEKGVEVHVVHEDATERGIQHSQMIEGVALLHRGQMAQMVAEYDQVWHW